MRDDRRTTWERAEPAALRKENAQLERATIGQIHTDSGGIHGSPPRALLKRDGVTEGRKSFA